MEGSGSGGAGPPVQSGPGASPRGMGLGRSGPLLQGKEGDSQHAAPRPSPEQLQGLLLVGDAASGSAGGHSRAAGGEAGAGHGPALGPSLSLGEGGERASQGGPAEGGEAYPVSLAGQSATRLSLGGASVITEGAAFGPEEDAGAVAGVAQGNIIPGAAMTGRHSNAGSTGGRGKPTGSGMAQLLRDLRASQSPQPQGTGPAAPPQQQKAKRRGLVVSDMCSCGSCPCRAILTSQA